MNACSSNSDVTKNDTTLINENQSASLHNQATTSNPPSQNSKRYLNEELSNRLSKIIATEIGEKEDPANLSAISSLLDRGADVNAKNSAAQSPLIEAAQNGHIKVVEMLISKGAEVNAQDDRGDTALMKAAGASDVKMVRLLLSKGAKANIKNNEGFTALSGSEMVGGSNDPQYLEIRRLLKKAGAK